MARAFPPPHVNELYDLRSKRWAAQTAAISNLFPWGLYSSSARFHIRLEDGPVAVEHTILQSVE
jgi:hypothetical protein